MPKVSKLTASRAQVQGPVEDHAHELEGYTVDFVRFNEDVDGTPLLRGLPDDRCQCPHWGYVISGRMTMRFADREEAYEAGEAWYSPPGHVPVGTAPGTELVMFSPTHELAVTEAAMERNMQALTSG
jgi:hypothetical protein